MFPLKTSSQFVVSSSIRAQTFSKVRINLFWSLLYLNKVNRLNTWNITMTLWQHVVSLHTSGAVDVHYVASLTVLLSHSHTCSQCPIITDVATDVIHVARYSRGGAKHRLRPQRTRDNLPTVRCPAPRRCPWSTSVSKLAGQSHQDLLLDQFIRKRKASCVCRLKT